MTPEDVMAAYETAASAHDLSATLRLIDPEAVYWFSDASRHVGRAAVELAMSTNFDTISHETYRIDNLRLIARSDEGGGLRLSVLLVGLGPRPAYRRSRAWPECLEENQHRLGRCPRASVERRRLTRRHSRRAARMRERVPAGMSDDEVYTEVGVS